MVVATSSSANSTGWSCKYCSKHFVVKKPFELHEELLCKQSDKPRTQVQAQQAAHLLHGYIQNSQLKLHKNTADTHTKMVEKISRPAGKQTAKKAEVNIVISSDEEDEDDDKDKNKSSYSRVIASSRQSNIPTRSTASKSVPVIVNKTNVQGKENAQNKVNPGRVTAPSKATVQTKSVSQVNPASKTNSPSPNTSSKATNHTANNVHTPTGVNMTTRAGYTRVNSASNSAVVSQVASNNTGRASASASRLFAANQVTNTGRSPNNTASRLTTSASQVNSSSNGSRTNYQSFTPQKVSNAIRPTTQSSNKSNQIKEKISQIITNKPSPPADDSDDDDIVLTSVDYTTIDPITRKQIVDPVKNKICNHVYEKSTIYESMDLAIKNKKPVRCPYFACVNKNYKKSDLVKDKTVTEYCEKALKAKKEEEAKENIDENKTDKPDVIKKTPVVNNVIKTNPVKSNVILRNNFKTNFKCDVCNTHFAKENLLAMHKRTKHSTAQNSIPQRTTNLKRLSNSLYDDSDSEDVTMPMAKRRC